MKNIKDLMIDELHDMHSSEQQIIQALPKMAMAAESSELKTAFQDHLKETRVQLQRLEKIFKLLKIKKGKKFCKGAEGLIKECKEVLREFKRKSPIRDAALISKAQRIEHYEISAYGTLRTFAQELDIDAIANLLQATLDEEAHADKKLTKIAEGGFLSSGINHEANIANIQSETTTLKPKRPPSRLKKRRPIQKPKSMAFSSPTKAKRKKAH